MSLVDPSLPLPYTAYLLAAGRSRRFGSNKAFARWQGTSFLNYQREVLQSHFRQVKVVAPASDTYRSLGVPHALVDRFSDQGPLAGLDTALQDARMSHRAQVLDRHWLFLASCDTFGVQTEDILTLAQALPEATGQYQAVLWQQKHRLEPLWGFYAVTLASVVYERLCDGCLPMHKLLADIRVKSYERCSPWIQVNAPTDFPEKA